MTGERLRAARSSRGLAVLAAAAAGLVAGAALDRLAPFPAADVLRGSEEAFAEGLEWRELPVGRHAPRRWTRPRALFRFRNLPPGPASLELAIRQHRRPVTVRVNGRLALQVPQGRSAQRLALGTLTTSTVEVELETEPTVDADGRVLGTRLDRVALLHARGGAPRLSLLIPFALAGAAAAALAMGAGFTPPAAVGVGTGLAGLMALLLAPCGLVRSSYAVALPALLIGSALLAAALARWSERRRAGARRWAFAAGLGAALVQGVAAVSPLLVTSDAAFHAHNLADVSRGRLLLTSVTPHDPPFRIPYGISFYVVLAPLARAGLDAIALVRWGAAVSGIAASLGLFVLLMRRSPRLAGLAVLLLQLLPISFVYYSEGTLSNVFGQSATTLFFAWWAGSAPLGWPAGALLLALGATAHLSSFVVLAVLTASLLVLRARGEALDRRRLLAGLVGLGVAAAYYAAFSGLVLEQLPRMLEGPGRGGGGETGPWPAWLAQAGAIVRGYGLPALGLALLGLPRPDRGPLERALVALWLSGAALCALALATPLEVRYVFALAPAVAVAAASGLERVWSAGAWQRIAAGTLLAAQVAIALKGLLEALLIRYRP